MIRLHKDSQTFLILMIGVIMTTILISVPTSAWSKANSRTDKLNDPSVRSALETIAKKEQAIKAEKLAVIKENLTPLEQQWGIQILGLRATAGGYMLDFRFRVVDAEKAYPLLSRKVKRYVVVDKSGAVLRIPFTAKLGSIRATVRTPNMVQNNRIYASLFANPGKHVKAGDHVSVVIGNFIASKVTVK